jgi:putative SOS response-associated peptidase YedK
MKLDKASLKKAAEPHPRWLQPGNPDRPPIDLLRAYDADKMTAWKVDKAVGNVKNDSPQLIEPATDPQERTAEPLRERPGSLFS